LSAKKTFLFYDIETSGLSCYFDQVLTFAAIRTDTDLVEIERNAITVCLRHDIVPSPSAFITHRLPYSDLQSGIGEYEAAGKIHCLVNTPGTISLGYNSLGFDDEFLRFAFYRNLLDPYTHQYSRGCSRMDLLPITTLYRIFKPEIIKWPEIDGKPTLKLEQISRLNRLVPSGRAHEAMTDVMATLELARALKTQGRMWDYCLDFFDKKKDRGRIETVKKQFRIKAGDYRLCIMVSPSFGAQSMYMAPVLFIGHSIKYTNQSLWLRLDREIEFKGPDGGMDELFVIRKRYGESKIVLPPAQRFWNRFSKETIDACERNRQLICDNEESFNRLVLHYQEFEYPFVPDLDPDASLYQAGFFSKNEKIDIALFHNASDQEKIKQCTMIKSSRIRDLAYRVIFRNFYDTAESSSLMKNYTEFMEQIRAAGPDNLMKGFRNDIRFTRREAAEEIGLLRDKNELDPEQLELLDWLESYIKIL